MPKSSSGAQYKYSKWSKTQNSLFDIQTNFVHINPEPLFHLDKTSPAVLNPATVPHSNSYLFYFFQFESQELLQNL